VSRSEILRVSELLATKLVENEFAAYLDLKALIASNDALSMRGFTIVSYALCGFANLGSLGIQIGVLSALAPSRTRLIARIGPSAMICGFISTLQAAGIAYVSPSVLSLFPSALVSLVLMCGSFALFAVACSSDPRMCCCVRGGVWEVLVRCPPAFLSTLSKISISFVEVPLV